MFCFVERGNFEKLAGKALESISFLQFVRMLFCANRFQIEETSPTLICGFFALTCCELQAARDNKT